MLPGSSSSAVEWVVVCLIADSSRSCWLADTTQACLDIKACPKNRCRGLNPVFAVRTRAPVCAVDKQQRRLVAEQGYGGAEEERKAPEGSCIIRRWSVVEWYDGVGWDTVKPCWILEPEAPSSWHGAWAPRRVGERSSWAGIRYWCRR